MLITAKNLRELSFGKLMEVYAEENWKSGEKLWPDEPEYRAIALAEQDFYDYLQQVFFHVPDARYMILEQGGKYVSALRLEPYRDGLLLTALETVPVYRNKGYATMLVKAVLESVTGTKVYSHVDKRNIASLRTHARCGFAVIQDYAVYADGSVDQKCVTLCV